MIEVGDYVSTDHRPGGLVQRFLGAYAIVDWPNGDVTAVLPSNLHKVPEE